MNGFRVASLQYYIRPVDSYSDFEAQLTGLVDTARDYNVKLLVLPEYFSIQLLTLANLERPINIQIRDLAHQEERIKETLTKLAKKSNIIIVAGTMPSFEKDEDKILNKCFVFTPDGSHQPQAKLHMTRFEKDEWLISPGSRLRLFETSFCKFAVAICYDVEFPEIARVAARMGAEILAVPSCTDERQGYLRVRYCAQARAIENQMYVIHSPTVGSLPMVPAVSMNYGIAAIYTPSDFSFARDGILAQGEVNQESMIIGDLDLELIRRSREDGTVLPLRDSHTTESLLKVVDHVKLPS